MQLWRLDTMGSVMIADPSAPSGVIEAKLISGIDDHSRYSSVIGKVVLRADQDADSKSTCGQVGLRQLWRLL